MSTAYKYLSNLLQMSGVSNLQGLLNLKICSIWSLAQDLSRCQHKFINISIPFDYNFIKKGTNDLKRAANLFQSGSFVKTTAYVDFSMIQNTSEA